ncbi:MAG: glycosyltransferase family 4 protein [Planctomycetota bacterium]|nr:glycosyltransferase family 4 protein [Planctomycetota bacterium]
MRIAYLVNQYPKTSHSFIRREIEVVESSGLDVMRISIRRTREPLVDSRDIAEAERTVNVLGGGLVRNSVAVVTALAAHPLRFARGLQSAWRLGWRSRRGRLVHFVYLVEACILRRMCAKAGVAHVHAHFATNPATVALLCEDLGGPTFSFTFHGPEFFEFPTHGALGFKVERAAFTVSISHHGRSQLMRTSERAHWSRIALVHCGVGAEYLDHPSTPIPDAPRLVCVARIEPAKGHMVLLQALAILAAEKLTFELVLVGDGEMRERVDRLAKELGIQDSVRCVGWKAGAGVIAELLAARALVLPSFEEGLPVVFMEALALERPVVSTFIAGIPELVKPGVSGWLVPASSVGSLADALREVLNASPADLQSMGKRGSALVRSSHDARREGSRLASLFEKTVREGRTRTSKAARVPAHAAAIPVHAKGEAR